MSGPMEFSSGMPPLLSPEEAERRRLWKRGCLAGLSLLLCIGLQLALTWVFSLGIQFLLMWCGRALGMSVQLDYYRYTNLLQVLVQPAAMLLPAGILVLFSRRGLKEMVPLGKPVKGIAAPSVGIMLGVSVVGSLLYQLLTSFTALFGVQPTMGDLGVGSYGLLDVGLYFLAVAVLPPVLEEIFFRGALMQSLREFGDGFALLFSALLFALMHGNLVQGPTPFSWGWGWGISPWCRDLCGCLC